MGLQNSIATLSFADGTPLDTLGQPRLVPEPTPPWSESLNNAPGAAPDTQSGGEAAAPPGCSVCGPTIPCSRRDVLPPDPFAGSLGPWVWGIVGMRAYPAGEVTASNGDEFHQLFSFDLDFNMWVWRQRRVYLFMDSRFWGQKATPGVTNPHQGALDFSKREFDLTPGLAWNYYGFLEARVFAYSYNNLNRGYSLTSPYGFNDGVGIENRYYINPTYAALGTPAFDKARNTFVSVGFYPSKSMVDPAGNEFKPGAFARAYLIWELLGPRLYLFTDDILTCEMAGAPRLFYTDSGVAFRPVRSVPRLEFRVGSEDTFDLQVRDMETSVYCSFRYIY